MGIADAIDDALEHFEEPPPNESNTCEWVILPLLYACGYAKKEILSRGADKAGSYPDYTIFPNEEAHKFFLEAKAWKISLEDGHANQALNYANQNGKRWVVLTNGQSWRLYDNRAQGVAKEKLVAEMVLTDKEDALRFLNAIGRQSVCSNGLESFVVEEKERKKKAKEEAERRRELAARREALSGIWQKEIAVSSSPLVSALLKHLRTYSGLSALAPEDIVAQFVSPSPQIMHEGPCLAESEATGEVLVVAASNAWGEYQALSAYICQPRRFFRHTSHMAFYAEGAIQPTVPRILEVVEACVLSEERIHSNKTLTVELRSRLLALVHSMKVKGIARNAKHEHKIIFLSPPDSPQTIQLSNVIQNDLVAKTGRPRAFVVGQRYVQMAKLRSGAAKSSQILD